jgi:hypothetical protein
LEKFNCIIIIATWSSGSTALAGFLHQCGAYTCPPHFKTSDARTPIAFEPVLYSDALRKLFDEFTLTKRGDFEVFRNFFEDFYYKEVSKAQDLGFEAIALKHPLQTLILSYLNNFLKPKFVFVTRPIEKIEATRARRKWHPVYGAQGAKQIYSTAHNFLISNSCPYLSVPYNTLITDVTARKTLLDFCNLSPTDEMLKNAADFLKK